MDRLELVILLALRIIGAYAGDGEPLRNGIGVNASPKTGTARSILVEHPQTGGGTSLLIHDQGDELFYVISGRGTATLGTDDSPKNPKLLKYD